MQHEVNGAARCFLGPNGFLGIRYDQRQADCSQTEFLECRGGGAADDAIRSDNRGVQFSKIFVRWCFDQTVSENFISRGGGRDRVGFGTNAWQFEFDDRLCQTHGDT